VHSDHASNPKVIFLRSRATDVEDRHNWDEKKILDIDRPVADILVSKLLALAERFQRSTQLLDKVDRAIQSRGSVPTITDGQNTLVPRYSEASTPSSTGLSSSSSTSINVDPSSSKEEWLGLREGIEVDSPDPEVEESLVQNLLQELTCEICLMLLYKPLTTPCQHVRFTGPIDIPSNITMSRRFVLLVCHGHWTTMIDVLCVDKTFSDMHTFKDILSTN
jgi:hypothetical protein